jgi:hypothetical protein
MSRLALATILQGQDYLTYLPMLYQTQRLPRVK